MVGVAQRDEAVVAGVGARHAHSKVVGFATGVDEVHDRERVGQGRGQIARKLHNRWMQVPRIGVQSFLLPRGNGCDVWIGVADVSHVVDQIQIGLARYVVEVGTFTPHNLQRLPEVEAEIASQSHLAFSPDRCGPSVGVGINPRTDPQQKIGIG